MGLTNKTDKEDYSKSIAMAIARKITIEIASHSDSSGGSRGQDDSETERDSKKGSDGEKVSQYTNVSSQVQKNRRMG